MKCPNCGAEMGENRVCPYCDSMMSYKDRREYERASKQGCLKCGSSNIKFNREKQGTANVDGTKIITYQTVGFCQDCGYTWFPESGRSENEVKKRFVHNHQEFQSREKYSQYYSDANKKKSGWLWLWILGWIFFFPIPLAILLFRIIKNFSVTGILVFMILIVILIILL